MEFGPILCGDPDPFGPGITSIAILGIFHIFVAAVAASRGAPKMARGWTLPSPPASLPGRMSVVFVLLMGFAALADNLEIGSTSSCDTVVASPESRLETHLALLVGVPVGLSAAIALLMATRAWLWPKAKTGTPASVSGAGRLSLGLALPEAEEESSP